MLKHILTVLLPLSFLLIMQIKVGMAQDERVVLVKKGFNLVERVLKQKKAIRLDENEKITHVNTEKVRKVKNLFVGLTGLPFGPEVDQPCLHAVTFGMRTGKLAMKMEERKQLGLTEETAGNQKLPSQNDELCMRCLMDLISEEVKVELEQALTLLQLDLEQTSSTLDMNETECLTLVHQMELEDGDKFFKYDLYAQMMTGYDLKGTLKTKQLEQQSHGSKMSAFGAFGILCFILLEYLQ